MDIKRAIKDKNNIIKALWIVAFAPVALIFLMLLLAATGLFGRIPSFEELENPKSNLATEIYGEDGHVIGTFFVQNRSYVQYAELFPQDSSSGRNCLVAVAECLRALLRTEAFFLRRAFAYSAANR